MIRGERGLYLRIDTAGRKYWILRYWENKKERQISLGSYPDLSLKDARIKRDEIQNARSNGESPFKKSQTFSEIANEWLKIRMENKAANYLDTIKFRLNKYILPAFGEKNLSEITAPEILNLCLKIEALGYDETARCVKVLIGQIFRFAIASGLINFDPTIALMGALKPRQNEHYATMTKPEEIALLMKSIKAYPYTIMRCAMLFSIYTVARPGEIRSAEWSEIQNDYLENSG